MSNQAEWITLETLIRELEFLKAKTKELEDKIYFAVDDRDNRIIELESLVDPYSNSGNPICNNNVEFLNTEWER